MYVSYDRREHLFLFVLFEVEGVILTTLFSVRAPPGRCCFVLSGRACGCIALNFTLTLRCAAVEQIHVCTLGEGIGDSPWFGDVRPP